ncbi:hypothetical protein ACFSM5_09145 [Lacibacterium aquatile]|uniref:Uncharacterized protein n=1 Tax=Lacibacterium aquatile TaxID=1168082 RepID=A0ABW5DRF1_9PROT
MLFMTIIDIPPPGSGDGLARSLRQFKRWLDRLPMGMMSAVLFAYWLALAALGLLAGFRLAGSLISSAILVGLAYGCYRLLRWTQPISDRSMLGRLAYIFSLSMTAITLGAALVVPAIILLGMTAWGILAALLWLIR